jgi:hypothetical protein
MLVVKGFLLATGLFVIVVLIAWNWASPKGTVFAPMGIDVNIFRYVGMCMIGFGLSSFLIGASLLLAGNAGKAALASRVRSALESAQPPH